MFCLKFINQNTPHYLKKAVILSDICSLREIFTSSFLNLKKVVVETEGKVTTIQGEYVDESNKTYIHDENSKKYCPTCPNRLGFEVDYTDILIVSQFVKPDGHMLPMSITGLCPVAHTKMIDNVHKAHRAGLMPELRPPLPDGKERTTLKSQYKWKKYNTYFNKEKLPYIIPHPYE